MISDTSPTDEIPQDVWDQARASAAKYSWPQTPSVVLAVAHGVMAERTRCGNIVERYPGQVSHRGDLEALIRSGGLVEPDGSISRFQPVISATEKVPK